MTITKKIVARMSLTCKVPQIQIGADVQSPHAIRLPVAILNPRIAGAYGGIRYACVSIGC